MLPDRFDHLNLLRGVAARLKVPYIDINDRLSGSDGLSKAHTHDGIHLNAAAYRIWTGAVRGFLRENGKL